MKIVSPTPYFGNNAADVHRVMKQRGGVLPLNANTTPGSVPPTWLQGPSLTTLQNSFAPLRAFTSVWDQTSYRPKSTNVLKYVAAGSATLTDPPDFQVGGSVVAPIECSVNHYSTPWPVSNLDLHSGLRQADLFTANWQKLAETLMQKVCTLLTTTNYPLAPIVSAPGAFTMGDCASIYGRLRGPSSLLLDSAYFGAISHSSSRGFNSGDSAHGWKGIYDSSAGWTSAGTKVRGCGLAITGIILVTGFTEEVLWSNLERTLIAIPGLDLMVEYNRWHDARTRTLWNSLDAVFGVAVGDPNALVLIKEP